MGPHSRKTLADRLANRQIKVGQQTSRARAIRSRIAKQIGGCGLWASTVFFFCTRANGERYVAVSI